MSLKIFSEVAPQVGEEQPLSSTAELISSWTTLDISAAFPVGKVPYSVKALIVLGADLPRDEHLIDSRILGRLRVRKLGDSTPPEEALEVTRYNLANETSVIYRDGEEYQNGGFLAVLSIPVDTDGKFEYQLQNDSVAPRTIIRLLKVTIVDEIIPTSEKGAANGVATLSAGTLVVENPVNATATPTADKIPIADGSALLDGWVTAGIPIAEKGAANGVASLDGSALVVENPANATATPAPNVIPISDGAGLLDGWITPPSAPAAFKVVDTLTVEVSHTSDTLETVLHTTVLSADEMGINGTLRIFASFRAIGTGNHQFFVRFGGALVSFWSVTSTNYMLDTTTVYIWNRGAANSQGAGIADAARHVKNTELPFSGAIDTTNNVDITFAAKNAVGGDTVYLREVVVEVYHKD